jgi:protein O-mannosyl-transferase
MQTSKRPFSSDALLRFSFLAVIAAYAQTINFGFVYDDFPEIAANPWLQSWSGLRLIFTQHSAAFLDTAVPARHYRPLYLAWLWAVQHLLGSAPGWFHLAAVLTHIAAVCLAYQLARKLLQDSLTAAIAALLFALHPAKVETIAWISGATEPLQAVFLFAALIAYIYARARPSWLPISAACFAAALLTKETSIVFPAIVIAYEATIARKPGTSWRPAALRLATLLLVLAAFLVLRTAILHGAGDTAVPQSPARVLFTAPLACWLLLRQLLLPYGLSAFYPILTVAKFSVIYFLLPAVGLIVLAVLYWRWARGVPVLQFPAAWFLLTLLPVVGEFSWVQLHDRHLYLPSFGFALMLALLLQQAAAWARIRSPHIPAVAALIIGAVLAIVSASEARIWGSELAVCERAVAVAPANFDALILLADTYTASGSPEKAAATLQAAVQRYPRSAKANAALGHHYYALHQYDVARPYLERVVSIGGDNDTRSTALYELAMLEGVEGKRDAAERHLREAVRLAPHIPGYGRALAKLLQSAAPAVPRHP